MTSNVYTSSSSFVVPAGVTSVVVEAWGGGGGGKGGQSGGNVYSGGGGGGGAYVRSVLAVTPSAELTVTVGGGGAGGGEGAVGDGAAGGDSWFDATGTLLAKGGSGATGQSGAAGGTTAASVGATKYQGGTGGAGAKANKNLGGGGGGSSAGTEADGGNGSVGTEPTGGAGGTAPAGGGDGGSGGDAMAAGSPGSAPGGGGGGGGNHTATGNGGGAGADGRVVVSYELPVMPDMLVLGTNGAVIASGSPASGADGTDYGDVTAGGARTHTFMITNAWDEEFSFEAVAIGGVNPDVFTVTAQPTSPLSPGDTTTFSILFEPVAMITYSAQVYITNDVPDKGPYTFALAGTGAAGPYVTTTIVTCASSSTFIVPDRVYSITVEAWGAGGGGKGGADNPAGGGGGGGAYARSVLEVEPEEEYTVTVGLGGAGGTENGGNGGDGADSWFGATNVVLAKGGAGSTALAGGAGGTTAASVGETRYQGGTGGTGGTSTPGDRGGGGGGSSAGMAADGVNGSNYVVGVGGVGGTAPTGGGDGGAGANVLLTGLAGSVPGGGGGGGGNSATTGNAGGAGADGRVVVTYILPPDILVFGTNKAVIASGSLPSSESGTAFGGVGVGSSRTNTFTITNAWSQAFTLDAVAIGGDHGGDFSVTSQPSSPLAKGGTTTLDIKFEPTTGDDRYGTVYISNSVPGRSPYTFMVSGNDFSTVWNGGGANGNWDTTANWVGGTVPGASDRASFYLGMASGTNINLNGNRSSWGCASMIWPTSRCVFTTTRSR